MANNKPEAYISPLSLSEQLSANFYTWEKRCRGWQIWNSPVELEPPFEPFFHYYPSQPVSAIDDGRKPTFLEKLWEGLMGTSNTTTPTPYLPEPSLDLTPSPFQDDSALKEIRISLSPDQKITASQTEQFLLNLSYCSLPVSFEVIGLNDSITVQLSCREPDYLQVKEQLQAYFPETAITEENDFLKNSWREEKKTMIVDFGLSHEFMRPLKTFNSFEPDPLIGIIGALDNLQEGELGVFQIILQPVRHPWPESIIRSVTDWEGHPFFTDSPEMVRLAQEKVTRPLFAVVMRVIGQSKVSNRAWEITRALASGLKVIANPGSNELIPLTNDGYDDSVHAEDVLFRQTHRSGMLLNSEELITLLHLPSVSVKTKKLVREVKKTKASPAIAAGHKLVLGENIHQGKTTVVTLSPEQRLRHTYVVGATGTGKSTLLLNLIIQDVSNGLGIAVLDPHGDLIDRILGNIPEERFEDVILLDPSDSDYPVGINILSAYSEIEKNVLSSVLVSILFRCSLFPLCMNVIDNNSESTGKKQNKRNGNQLLSHIFPLCCFIIIQLLSPSLILFNALTITCATAFRLVFFSVSLTG
ncbi:MAG TPA: DUF87 domain-containing protein [Thermodesulfobacteriota bacterium]|nr:DUF87 domain-containing protein [Thermodesulfobacteriota bacterium]